MNLTDRQKFALAKRRFRRSLALAIYPQLGIVTIPELDIEFQEGLEAGMQVLEWQEEITKMRIQRAHESGIAVGIEAAKEERDV